METKSFDKIKEIEILLIPGGKGTRTLVSNHEFIKNISLLSKMSKYTLTVCTGSAILAKTGLLDNREATTNKKAFDWVCSQRKEVIWQKKARWTNSDNYYTSSGVSAGIDMALGFINDLYGKNLAVKIAEDIEYCWNNNKNDDIFSEYTERVKII